MRESIEKNIDNKFNRFGIESYYKQIKPYRIQKN
jgi:hypothetical protein